MQPPLVETIMWRILAYVFLITFIVFVISQMILPLFSSRLEPFWLFRPARKNNENRVGNKQPGEIDITPPPAKPAPASTGQAAPTQTMVTQKDHENTP